ncbi:hypothetical protein ACFSTC_48480 [Nonomuraea ferruginea]
MEVVKAVREVAVTDLEVSPAARPAGVAAGPARAGRGGRGGRR